MPQATLKRHTQRTHTRLWMTSTSHTPAWKGRSIACRPHEASPEAASLATCCNPRLATGRRHPAKSQTATIPRAAAQCMTIAARDSMRPPSRALCLAAHGAHLTTIPMHPRPHEGLEAPDGPACVSWRGAREHKQHKQLSPNGAATSIACLNLRHPPSPAHALLRSSSLLVDLLGRLPRATPLLGGDPLGHHTSLEGSALQLLTTCEAEAANITNASSIMHRLVLLLLLTLASPQLRRSGAARVNRS